MARCQLVLEVVCREWRLWELAVKVVGRWRRKKNLSEVSFADLNTAAVGVDRRV